MEPRRQLNTVKAVFADCFLSQDVIVEMGLTNAQFFWDHYHLYNQIWPKKMSPHVFGRVQTQLHSLLKAHSEAAFKAAFDSICSELGRESNAVRYLETNYYSCPERFAKYAIDRVEFTMGREGSTASEQNHSSVSAFFDGGGKTHDMHMQICMLLQRQGEINNGRNMAAHKYRRQTSKSSNPAQAVLSKHCFENHWTTALLEATHYAVTHSDADSVTVTRKGKSPTSGRNWCIGERCTCVKRLPCGVQCVHEIVANDMRFVKTLFHPRHYQDHEQKLMLFVRGNQQLSVTMDDYVAEVELVKDNAAVYGEIDSSDVPEANNFASFGNDDNHYSEDDNHYSEDDDDDDNDDNDDDENVPLSSLVATSAIASHASTTDAHECLPASVSSERIDYQDLHVLFDQAVNATNNSQRLKKILAGVLTATTDLITSAKGGNEPQVRDFEKIIADSCASLRPQRRRGGSVVNPTSNSTQPTSGGLKAKSAAAQTSGRPEKIRKRSSTESNIPSRGNRSKRRVCGFCSRQGHTITTCPSFNKWGCKPKEDKETIHRCLLDCNDIMYRQVPLPENQDSEQHPALVNVPIGTEWLCIHQKCYKDPSNRSSSNNLFFIVSCLQDGKVMDEKYHHRAMKLVAISTWVATKFARTILDLISLKSGKPINKNDAEEV
jgi:hypothetical protein